MNEIIKNAEKAVQNEHDQHKHRNVRRKKVHNIGIAVKIDIAEHLPQAHNYSFLLLKILHNSPAIEPKNIKNNSPSDTE